MTEGKRGSIWKLNFWKDAIFAFEDISWRILDLYYGIKVNQRSPIEVYVYGIWGKICYDNFAQKVNERGTWLCDSVIEGLCLNNWYWSFVLVLIMLNVWRYDGDSMGIILCFEQLFKEIEAEIIFHHQQLMQLQSLSILILTVCVLYQIKPMENFNIDINGSPNASSAGSSEISHEALLELCVVGTLLIDKPVRFQIMEDRLPSIWRPGQGVTIIQADENKFLFQFYQEWDMERILQNGPWTFDGYLMVLKKMAIGEATADVVLDEVEVWVRVFNLPHGYMNEYVGMLLGRHIGRYVKYDESNYYGPMRMFMRIRVALNVNEPLKRSMVFEKEDGNTVHVYFKYERLRVFCYICGIMGHTHNFCPKRLEPGYVEEIKGWGKFLNAGGRTIGGGVTVNRWLRGGRSAGRGGLDGGRGGLGGGRGGADNNPANVVVMSHSSEHALFGRVRVLRGGYFTLHRIVITIISHNGGGEGQWIPFELNETNIENQRTIMRLVNGLGARNGEARNDNSAAAGNNSVNSNAAGEQTTQLMLGDACKGRTSSNDMLMLTGCNQVLGMPIVNSGGAKQVNTVIGETSEVGRVVCNKKKNKPVPTRPLIAEPLVIREGVHAVNNSQAMEVPHGDKGKGKMEDGPSIKKRTRPNMSTGGTGNSEGAVEQENMQMLVDTVQNNPLFSDNIVMAEAENQPRQQP